MLPYLDDEYYTGIVNREQIMISHGEKKKYNQNKLSYSIHCFSWVILICYCIWMPKYFSKEIISDNGKIYPLIGLV